VGVVEVKEEEEEKGEEEEEEWCHLPYTCRRQCKSTHWDSRFDLLK